MFVSVKQKSLGGSCANVSFVFNLSFEVNNGEAKTTRASISMSLV